MIALSYRQTGHRRDAIEILWKQNYEQKSQIKNNDFLKRIDHDFKGKTNNNNNKKKNMSLELWQTFVLLKVFCNNRCCGVIGLYEKRITPETE